MECPNCDANFTGNLARIADLSLTPCHPSRIGRPILCDAPTAVEQPARDTPYSEKGRTIALVLAFLSLIGVAGLWRLLQRSSLPVQIWTLGDRQFDI